ncbi:MAG TPA: RHS repeat-associated core domain-containing protein [bacterium]|nr:RHS repeat-associated core domain-containing protein [bacterium]
MMNLPNRKRPDGTAIGMIYELIQNSYAANTGKLMKITVPGRGDITLTYETTGGKKLDTILTPEGNGLAYDYTGALLATETWSGETAGTVGRTYNNDFRVSALTVNGVATAYTYDNDGLLTGAGDLVVTRDPQSGLVTGTTLGALTTAQTYTSFGELAHYEAGTLYSYDFTERDRLGRIVEKVETIDGLAKTYRYGYDSAGRLATVWENGFVTGTYGYDQNGNRTTHGGLAATYDDQDRMMTYGDNAYTYTVNGDILTKTDTQGTPDTADDELTGYTHDALGNLTGVTLPDGTAITYVYDGRNRLIAKRVNGTVDYRLIYAGQLAPVAKVDASGATIEQYIYGLGVNAPDYILKDSVNYRLVKDHLGTPRLVVNATTGVVVKRIDLDEFGNIVAETGTFDIPFGFAGGIRDTDTGLTKFGARWYDPETGRWLEKEPLGFRGGMNFYSYARNNPVNKVDRTGLAPGDFYSNYDDARKDQVVDLIFEYTERWKANNGPYEIGSEIYVAYRYNEDTQACEMGFSYTTPHDDDKRDDEVSINYVDGIVAFTHMHPRGSSILDSPTDTRIADKDRIIINAIRQSGGSWFVESYDPSKPPNERYHIEEHK